MENANWIDRRKAEVALRFIKLGHEITKVMIFQHGATRLFKTPSKLYNKRKDK